MNSANTIADLRDLLRGKFGSDQSFSPVTEPSEASVVSLDDMRFQRGWLHEVIAGSTSTGVGWLIDRLQGEATAQAAMALIDGRDSFDPSAARTGAFLWVRCSQTADAVTAADWLLRDGNMRIVLLDLQLNSLPEVRRIRSSSWYRLRALAKESEAAFVVFTQEKVVPCAQLSARFSTGSSLSLFDQRREDIRLSLTMEKGPSVVRAS